MIVQSGVDTWSVAWYLLEGSPAHRAADHLCDQPGPRGRLMKGEVAGHKIGYFPGQRMLYAEGHPSDLGGLARSDQLPDAFERLQGSMQDYGILPPRYDQRSFASAHELRRVLGGCGFAGVRRLDTTADIHFERGEEGLAALAGVASIPVPRHITDTWRHPGERHVRAVFLRGYSGKQILGRWYDKGVETREQAKGLRIRPEDQRRFPSGARPTIEAVADPTTLRGLFVGRFATLYQAAKGVTVADLNTLAVKMKQMQRDGDISPTTAKRIAGHILLDAVDGQEQSRSTVFADRAEARKHGLVLSTGPDDDVTVDLAQIIEEAMDSDTWGAEG